MPSVLVVNPDPQVRAEFRKICAPEFEVSEAETGREVLERVRTERPDIVVLEMFLNGESGFSVCRTLRSESDTQDVLVMILTDSGSEQDRVLALELGADDVVSRPVASRELALRLKALLHRVKRESDAVQVRRTLRFGTLVLDPESRAVKAGDASIPLTHTEFSILTILMQRPGRVFRRDEIMDEIWGESDTRTPRVIDTHVKSIRRKLGAQGGVIESLHGVGYRLADRFQPSAPR